MDLNYFKHAGNGESSLDYGNRPRERERERERGERRDRERERNAGEVPLSGSKARILMRL